MFNRNFCRFCLIVTGSFFGTVGAETPDPSIYEWTEEFAGEPLDLTGYQRAFTDDFDELTVVRGTRQRGAWFSPVHASYGQAIFDKFDDAEGTYTVADGILRIRASLDSDGVWHGGNIQTVNTEGIGFAQSMGYFEARMRFPDMPGAWPSFWLKSQAEHWDPSVIRTEIDVIEWYGGDPTGHHRTVHLRPATGEEFRTPGRLQENWYDSNLSRHQGMAGQWHTYGLLITPELTTVYFDRTEVSRFPTLDEFEVPLYMLISLTLYEEDLAIAQSPIILEVDYVHTYTDVVPDPPVSLQVR